MKKQKKKQSEVKKMVVKHICKTCDKKFDLENGKTLKEVNLFESDIELTVVECPHCKATEVVQVDNRETKEILRRILSKMRLMRVSKTKSKRESAQLSNLNRMLNKRRKELLESYKQTPLQ